jgi:hypothetical protein
VDFVERVFLAPVKRASGPREQVGHTQTDNDGHERRDELETAHQVLRVLHGALSLAHADQHALPKHYKPCAESCFGNSQFSA